MRLLRRSVMTFILPLALHAQQIDARSWQSSLDRALHGSSASAVVIDVTTGKTLASYRLPAAPPQEPGSTLKPLIAAIALSSGTVTAQTEVQCDGTLVIGQHNLRCSHPRSVTIFDLQHAIAYSCNSWFAQLAEHMSGQQLGEGLRAYGLTVFGVPSTRDQRQLLALGLQDVRVTPLQLADAYRQLSSQLDGSHFAPIQAGMFDSVTYGMAHNAVVAGLMLAGKTGTAAKPGSAITHGLFAGILYSQATRQPDAIIVVVVPQGTGADAAAFAQRILLRWSGK